MSKGYPITTMICTDCGAAYKGGRLSYFCPKCRGRRISEAAKKRCLNRAGIEARARKPSRRTDDGKG